jgi:hypothetical protein
MKTIFFSLLLLFVLNGLHAQMITGVWRGKIGNGIKPQKLELKLIQKGDSIAGTSYYYESENNYRRYNVKGFFNQQTNEVVWWDDELIEQVVPGFRVLSPNEIPLLMEADFNCPGDGTMKLDGKAVTKEENKNKGDVLLEKINQPLFTDEWIWVINNYTFGANDPEIIDSIATLHKPVRKSIVTKPIEATPTKEKPVTEPTVVLQKQEQPVIKTNVPAGNPVQKKTDVISKALAIEEKFIKRKKTLAMELPLEGDTIEIHFYDNAEIDGDSISLFMNNQLVFEHIRLSDKPYIIKFAVSELSETSELVMVAENLGAIPPNTSYMIATINNQRYTANLESTEGSSSMIRFIRRNEK